MEYYEVFMKVILKEVAKFKLNIDVYSTHIVQLTAALNENFDIPYNRCAYMYRYGTVLTYLFNDCINIFFASSSLTKVIFSMWKSYAEVKVCSLSTGPGLDFIGFMLAVLEYDSSPPNFEVKVLSKHGAWRNTRNLILEVFNDPVSGSEFSKKPLQYQNIKVVQLDFLQNYSFGNVTAASEANVIFMMKTLNLLAPGAPQERLLLQMFKEFVASLKPEAVIFCLDTKPSIAVLTEAILHFPGKFLYGPNLHTAKLPATFPEFNGHNPTLSARGMFFVWQKSPDPLDSNVTPISSKSIGTKSNANLISVDNSLNESSASSVENVSNIDVKDSDNLNLPWMELKSFWQCSSPKTKEVLKKLMLTDEGSLEHINDFMSQAQKDNTSEENSIKIFQNVTVEDIKSSRKEVGLNLNTTEALRSEGTQLISACSLSELRDDLSMNNKKNTFNNYCDMHSYTNRSRSSSDSGFTCDNKRFEEFLSSCQSTSSKSFPPVDLDKLPFESDYQELVEDNSKKTVMPKENPKPFLPLENKTIQTDRFLDSTTDPSSVKALTNRIRQLAISLDSASLDNSKNTVMPKENPKPFLPLENKSIQTDRLLDSTTAPSSIEALTNRIRQLVCSLDSASQQNDPSNSASGDFNQHNEGPRPSDCTEKPSCSKNSPSLGSKDQGSFPSYQSCRNAPCQNTGSHHSCHCSHNQCMNCCFQFCCTQLIPRCSFSCHHQSRENNLANVTSPNIVIPLQNVSDDALLQIVSILKSESNT